MKMAQTLEAVSLLATPEVSPGGGGPARPGEPAAHSHRALPAPLCEQQ